MARIVFPEGVTPEVKLLKAVVKKHTDDGDASPIKDYLDQNEVSLDKALLFAAQAENIEATRVLLNSQSGNFIQLRDLSFHPLLSRFKGEVQCLKSIYQNNPKELVNWGINIEGDAKVVYPVGFGELCTTMTSFITKHLGFAAGSSPLDAYMAQHHIDVAADKTSISTAISFHDKAVAAAGQAENLTQQRNILWNPTVTQLKGIGNFLMNFYGENTKGTGNYGYVVDNSTPKPKVVNSTIKLLDKITLKGIVIGGTITNNGTEDIHLYKGKTTTGNPIILKPGEKHGVAKGFSTITISNPSLLTTAKISALRSK